MLVSVSGFSAVSFGLKSRVRRAVLPVLALLLCLAVPAWAQGVAPKQSDADALARIKNDNDKSTPPQLTGDNWDTGNYATAPFTGVNGVTWNGAGPGAQVTQLRQCSHEIV